MDEKKIERAALEAMDRNKRANSPVTLENQIAKAVAAAIAEYDKQKSE